MPTTTVNFSNRPQHRLEYTVNSSVGATTTTFTWSLRILTSGNINTPYGTGSYNNSTSPATTFVGGTSNGSQSFGYDYRSPNQNRTYTFSGGTRSAPRGSGNYTFTMSVSMGSLIGSATAQITISSGTAPTPAPTWTTLSLNAIARVGSSFSQQLEASGATSYALASGSLPGGISLNTSTGLLSASSVNAGTSTAFNFTVNATNAGGTTTSNTFTINRRQPLVSWTDDVLSSDLRVGTFYSDSVSASNASSYSVVGLPSGGLSHSSGAVSGTPTGTSSISFTITASNADGEGSDKSYTLTPKPRLPVWTDNTLSTTSVKVNQDYNDGVVANYATAYALHNGSLPPGIDLDLNSGVLAGVPTATGTYSFVLRAANDIDERIFTSTLSILVEPGGSAKIWNGSAWVVVPFKVWNGSTWVEAPAKVWNGSTWIDPTV